MQGRTDRLLPDRLDARAAAAGLPARGEGPRAAPLRMARAAHRLDLLPVLLHLMGALALWPREAGAATATNSLSSQTTVTTACNVSGSTLSFGTTINPIGAVPIDASSTLTVECTNSTTFTLSLNAGINAGGFTNFSQRKLKNGSYTLSYQLYTDSGRTTVWGDGTGGSSTYGGTGTGNLQTVYLYGRLPTLTGAVPGTYTDTVTVTITY